MSASVQSLSQQTQKDFEHTFSANQEVHELGCKIKESNIHISAG